jgi:hypothetical protein
MNAARCAWEVSAGLIPGEPMPEYTRRWCLDADQWYGPDGQPTPQGVALFNSYLVAAQEYARFLMNPGVLNWVKVEWVWF